MRGEGEGVAKKLFPTVWATNGPAHLRRIGKPISVIILSKPPALPGARVLLGFRRQAPGGWLYAFFLHAARNVLVQDA